MYPAGHLDGSPLQILAAVVPPSTSSSNPRLLWVFVAATSVLIVVVLFFAFRADSSAGKWLRQFASRLYIAARKIPSSPISVNILAPLGLAVIVWAVLRIIGLTEPVPWSIGSAITLMMLILVWHHRRADKEKRSAQQERDNLVAYQAKTSRWTDQIDLILGPFHDEAQPLVADIIDSRMTDMGQIISGLLDGGYTPETPAELASLFRYFFQRGGANYSGIDSHLPTEYLSTYDWYLTVHSNGIDYRKEMAVTPGDRRIIVASADELLDCFYESQASYTRFLKWHRDKQVDLYWVDSEQVNEFRLQCSMPLDADVSLWESFAVIFEPQPDTNPDPDGVLDQQTVKLRMIAPGVDSKNPPTIDQVKEFVRLVDSAIQPLGVDPPGQSIISEEAALQWEGYVGPDRRLSPDGPLYSLLKAELEDRQLILDAAAGIGAESICLVSEMGKSVISNEMDKKFRSVMSEYSRVRNRTLEVKESSWEDLGNGRVIGGGFRFDAVLCLGNSMCMVQNEARRQRALQSFCELLCPGGILIIDERNFEFMFEHRRNILKDPYKYFPPIRSDPMYRGERVRGTPVKISDNKVHWAVFSVPEGTTHMSAEDIERSSLGKPFELYPFRFGNLVEEMTKIESGFRLLRTYVDLVMCHDGPPPSETKKTAQFFTYILERITA